MIYDRIWEKYDRLRFPYFVVYDTVYDRLQPYTESVTVDLDCYIMFCITWNNLYRRNSCINVIHDNNMCCNQVPILILLYVLSSDLPHIVWLLLNEKSE